VPPSPAAPQRCPLLPTANEGSSLALLGGGSGRGCCTGSTPEAGGDLLHPVLAAQGWWHFGNRLPGELGLSTIASTKRAKLLAEAFWQGLALSSAGERLPGWLRQIPPRSEMTWPR